MLNTIVPGFKNSGPKNIINTNFSNTGGGGGTFNAIANLGTGLPILSTSGSTIRAVSLLAGNGIDLTSDGLTITIEAEPNTQILPFQFDQKTLYVSQNHPNADQPGSRIFSTIQAAITYNADTEGIIQIAPGNYAENLTISRTSQLGFIAQSIVQTTSLNITFNAANSVYFVGNQGKFIVDTITANSTIPGAYLGFDNLQCGTSFSDLSAPGTPILTILRNSTVNDMTLQILYESIDNNFSGTTIDVLQAMGKCNDCVFTCTNLNINSYLDATSGFRNCSFDTPNGIYTSPTNTMKMDSNSNFSTNTNTWNLSGCTVLQLEALNLNSVYGVLPIANGGTNSSAIGSAGSVLYSNGTAVASTSVGTAGQILTSNGAATPTWVTPSGSGVSTFSAGMTGFTPNVATSGAVVLSGTLNETHGGTNQTTYTLGDILYCSAPNTLSKLSIGSNNQVIKSNGTTPQWINPNTLVSEISGFSGTISTNPVNPYGSAIQALWSQSINGLNISLDSVGRVTQVQEVQKFFINNPTVGFVSFPLFSVPDLVYPPNIIGNVIIHYFEVRVILCRFSSFSNLQTINFSFVIHQSSSNVKTIQPDNNAPAYTYRTIPKFNPNYKTYFDQLPVGSNYAIYNLNLDTGSGVPIINGNIEFNLSITDINNYNIIFQTNKYSIYN